MDLKRQKIDVLGVAVGDISEKEAILAICQMAKDKKRSHYAVTVNSEFVMMARKNRDFARILKRADLALPDGAGVVLAKRIFGGKIQNRITGVDLVEKLCAEAAKEAVSVGFLGGFDNVAEIVAKRQKAKNPSLPVVFAEPGECAIGSDLRLRTAINASGRIGILFVAYGMGQQEFWIRRNLGKVNVGVFIGVGGAFDYLSMVKRRAPKFMQSVGLEWSWRLLMEPVRIWRMRVLPAFLFLVMTKVLLKFVKNVF